MTPAMQKLVAISVEMGLGKRGLEESLLYLTEHQEVIHEGVHDALVRANDDFDMAMALVDTSKSMLTRDLLFRRRGRAGLEETGKQIIFAMTRPKFADQFVESLPETALCNFYLGPKGDLWALIVQNLGPDRELGKAVLRILDESEGANFQAKLIAYASRELGKPPDFTLQSELLQTIGSVLIPFFVRMGVPRRLVLISHRWLHLLPLHAMFVTAGPQNLYLDGFVRETVYASCLTELLYGDVDLTSPKAAAQPRMLAALDVAAAGLPWISVERKFFEALRRLGWSLDVITRYAQLPTDMTCYAFLNLSGHAISDPNVWGGSYIDFDHTTITAEEIANSWNLDGQPFVTLAACETAVNTSAMPMLDEYCGLDRAFRVAGAKAIFAALWPIADPVAALASMILPTWILQHNVTPPQALTIFQSNLRRGDWKTWLLTEEQIEAMAFIDQLAAESVRSAYEEFRLFDVDAFSHPAHWSVIRCYA